LLYVNKAGSYQSSNRTTDHATNNNGGEMILMVWMFGTVIGTMIGCFVFEHVSCCFGGDFGANNEEETNYGN
jgi:hypothetical protein